MDGRKVEAYLSRFKVKEPVSDLKRKTLLRAQAVWQENMNPVLLPGYNLGLLKGYAWGLAFALVLSVITSQIDTCLTSRIVEGESRTAKVVSPEKEEMEDFLADLGLDKNYRRLICRLREDNNRENEVPLATLLKEQRRLWKELQADFPEVL